MKIATYHKNRGDFVEFCKGAAPFHKILGASRVYITTLFTFHYDITVKTVNHYRKFLDDSRIYVGGIAATIMPEKFREDCGNVNIQTGQRTSSADLGYGDDVNIDLLPLDYDILDDVSYEYPAADNFFAYATRGCANKCRFCAVPILEPEFHDTNNLKVQIEQAREKYGDRRSILLMDNNVLCSQNLNKITADLNELGFIKDVNNFVTPNQFVLSMAKIRRRIETKNETYFVAKFTVEYLKRFSTRVTGRETSKTLSEILASIDGGENAIEVMENNYDAIVEIVDRYRSKLKMQRFVDFNQGIDARRLTDENMNAISSLPLKPFRLAYDNAKYTETYNKSFKIAYRHGVRSFSNYMLYNYDERPEELWIRLNNNVQLCKELPESNSFSFPMKYAHIGMTDRTYIGEHWTKKQLDAMNVILNVTKGVVMKEEDFFGRAYGHSEEEFLKILTMPSEFIKHRTYFDNNGLNDAWGADYDVLTRNQRKELLKILSKESHDIPEELVKILSYYKITKKTKSIRLIADEDRNTGNCDSEQGTLI